ncbi:MAG: 23S rRNA (guanosine(2251)-2'-O)-methyltransferase RlmB [Rudaea sp.]
MEKGKVVELLKNRVAKENRAEDANLIFGRNAVLQALRAGKEVKRLYVARGTQRDGMLAEALAEARRAQVPIVELDRPAMDRMVRRGALHQGVIAEAAEFEYADLQDILEAAAASGEPAFLLLLDNVQYVKNFGALLRTAEAVGIHGVIIPEHRQAGVTAEVRKASAGAVDFLRVAQVTNLARTIDELKRAGVWVVGIEETQDARLYTQGDYSAPVAFVVGSELEGLRRLTRDKCDYIVTIPMWGQTPSLNVSVAGSIVLYEVMRQRRHLPGPG